MGKKAKKEKQFLDQLRQSALKVDPESQWYKIADTPGFAYSMDKPFDALWMCQGVLYCIEAKFHGSHNAMSLEKIRWPRVKTDRFMNQTEVPGQVEKLQDWARAGARSYFLFEVKNEKEHFAVFHTPETVQHWKDSGAASVTTEAMKEDAVFMMYRVKHLRHGTYWPLDRFLHVVNKAIAE